MSVSLGLTEERVSFYSSRWVDVTGTGSYTDQAGNTGRLEVSGLSMTAAEANDVTLNLRCEGGSASCVAAGQFRGNFSGPTVITGVFDDLGPGPTYPLVLLKRN